MVETSTGTKKVHYAIWIFIACCCTAAGGFALAVGLIGVYMVPVSAAYGISLTEFSLNGVALAVVQMIAFPIWGQLMKKNIRLCFIVGGIFEVVSILLYVFIDSVPGVLLAGGLCGVALPMVFFLTIPTMCTNWFAPKVRGKFLGIAMAFTGISTFVWAPLFTQILLTMGYQFTYVINAIGVVILLLPGAFIFKFSPEEMGLKPYGYDPNDEQAEKQAGSQVGVSAPSAMKTVAFYMMFIAMAAVSIGMGFSNCSRAWAGEAFAGTDLAESAAMIGAWMISAAAIGNLVGKITYGALADKWGARLATNVFLVLFILSFVVWWAFGGNMVTAIIGAFLLGTHNGIASVGNPYIVRSIYGGGDYQKIYSRVSMGNAIVGGFSMTILTAAAAGAGGFTSNVYYLIGMALVVVLAIVLNIAISFIGKIPFDFKPSEAK
jgi:MFS family permease